MNCPMCRRWQDDAEMRIAQLEHCNVVLNRDQFFPGYTLVFSKSHVTELFHLGATSRQGVIEEVNRVAVALDHVYRPTKMNYELLGNMVPHMHWHLVPRFTTDALWPRPIWSEAHAEKLLTPAEYAEAIRKIRAALAAHG